MTTQRFPLIDLLRGLAVILMIIFHFFYDLKIFGFVNIHFTRDPFWYYLPRFIVFLFLFSMGLALPLVHSPHIRWKPFWKRLGKISFFALLISLFTYFFFRERWIYFGTLHCIALTSLLAIGQVNWRWPNLALAFAILIPSALGYDLPFFRLPHPAMDYISIFPWIGVVWLGIFCFHQGLHARRIAPFFGENFFLYLGRHSLGIYLLHQPILFSTVWLYSKTRGHWP